MQPSKRTHLLSLLVLIDEEVEVKWWPYLFFSPSSLNLQQNSCALLLIICSENLYVSKLFCYVYKHNFIIILRYNLCGTSVFCLNGGLTLLTYPFFQRVWSHCWENMSKYCSRMLSNWKRKVTRLKTEFW